MQLLDDFLAYETENNLFDLKYKDVYFWEMLRVPLFNSIYFSDAFSNVHPDRHTKTIGAKLQFIKHIGSQMRYWFAKNTHTLLVHYAFIEKKVAGTTINPYIHFLKEDTTIDKSFFTCYDNNWPASTKDMNNALMELLCLPTRVLHKIGLKLKLLRLPALKKVVADINRQFGATLDANALLDQVVMFCAKYRVMERYYRHLLKNGQYKAIVIGCHYDLFNYALVAAAKTLGIPVIELQHGVIGKYHVAYHFADLNRVNRYLPDHVFFFGEYWQKTAKLLAGINGVSTGFPMMDDARQRYGDATPDEKTVIFYSTGLVGKELSQFAVRFADLAVKSNYKIIYKFHPSERLSWRQLYPWLLECKAITCDDSIEEVYSFLAKARHHVGVATMVLFEAIAFGRNAYVYRELQSDYMDDAVSGGYATGFHTAAELLSIIETSATGGTDPKAADYFYQANSRETILQELARIINKQPH